MPPSMTSLAREPEQREDEPAPAKRVDAQDQPRYPMGMQMYLDAQEIDKLGLGGAQVGDELMVAMKVRVTSVRQSEEMDGDTDRSVSLQPIEATADQPRRDRAASMFGGGGDTT